MINREAISKVRSPCVSNCCLDGDDVCLGCFRTLDDILVWSESSDSQRLEIVKAAKQRSLLSKRKYKL
ncbi:MAG: DUF1289 domain-containing protein [Gammaproteobacteria bacterium]|nr:MAG: DUF1289 domain-containing protein [Gammaproteobacteria bacterium]